MVLYQCSAANRATSRPDFLPHSHNYPDSRLELNHLPLNKMENSFPACYACRSPRAFPFIHGTFLDKVPWLSLLRRPLISPGPLVYFKRGRSQLSGSHPLLRRQVLRLSQITNKTQTRWPKFPDDGCHK